MAVRLYSVQYPNAKYGQHFTVQNAIDSQLLCSESISM